MKLIGSKGLGVIQKLIPGKKKSCQRAPSGKHILIACFPKSGSTYLSSLVSLITGYRNIMMIQRGEHNEQDLYSNVIDGVKFENTVTQQHVKGTYNNLKIINTYNFNTIVLTRNIFDVVISLRDHIENEDHKSPSGYVHAEYFSMSNTKKLDYLIKIHLPWYFNFLVSWHEASISNRVLWLSYQELFPDPKTPVSKLLDYCQIDYNENQLNKDIESIAHMNTRKNIGVQGRGAQLTSAQRTTIYDLAKCWCLESSVMETIGIVE